MKGSFAIALVISLVFVAGLFLLYLITYTYNPPMNRRVCCEEMCKDKELTFYETKYIEKTLMCICKDKSGSFSDFELNDDVCIKILGGNNETENG